MKPKLKVYVDKKVGDYRVEYFKLKDKDTFRFETLRSIVSDHTIHVGLETNLLSSNESSESYVQALEDYFTQNNLPFWCNPVASTKKRMLFGITLKGGDEMAYVCFCELTKAQLTEDFYNRFLKNQDIIVGIAPKKSFDEMSLKLRRKYESTFPQTVDYEAFYYDSSIFSVARSSIDLNTVIV